MLEFCPSCKRLLQFGEWKGKQVGKCECGFIRTVGINIQSEEKSNLQEIGSGVLENNFKDGFNFSCKKCGHDKADVRDMGEILGNEKSVTLFTCLKCGSVERT